MSLEGYTKRAAIPAEAAHPWLERGFRPFFALAALHASLFVPAWAAMAVGRLAAPSWLAPSLWHAHEMIYGLALAAAAGFLLTAVPVWTGAAPVRGRLLAAAALVWVLGRVALLCAGLLPATLVALLDLAFPATLLALLLPPLLRPGQARNRGFPAVAAVLLGANVALHLDALGLAPGVGMRAARVAIDCVLLLVVLVGGRIVPSFTQNALRREGSELQVRSHPWLDAASIAAVVAVLAGDVLAPFGPAAGAGKLAAAGLLALRLGGWQPLWTRGDPLLWSLHAGFACAPLGLALLGAAELGAPIPPAAGLHTLGIGCFGTLILSVMSRVSLGHTGRPLHAPPALPFAYGAVLVAAALRVAGALQPALAPAMLIASAALFSAAFMTYLVVYAPFLLAPRADGKPG